VDPKKCRYDFHIRRGCLYAICNFSCISRAYKRQTPDSRIQAPVVWRLYAPEMHEKFPPFCRKEVHGTVRKHVSQYVVDAAALMTIDTNRPDIEAVHEVKALILESVIA
jgi:hypothetical protein